MRILLIEDDNETRGYVASGLRQEGHVVDIAENGVDGLHLAIEGGADLLIVDRMLPDLDGISLIKSMRAAGKTAPVLLLTAMGGIEDRVAGLEAGGDDYLVKPFAFSELIARVNALLRRAPMREETALIEVGDLKIDRLRRRVTRAGREIQLQAREYQLLDYLMSHAGKVVTRTMLLEAVWDFHFDPGTNIVETHVSRLRAKLGDGAASVIRTVRGAGYMINADE
jgi:two-component system OmpR family response regulator